MNLIFNRKFILILIFMLAMQNCGKNNTEQAQLLTPFHAGYGYIHSGTSSVAGAVGSAELDDPIALQVDANGKQVVAGTSKNQAGGTELTLWRYNSDGSVDSTFGSGGSTHHGATGIASATGASTNDSPTQLRIDHLGRYVVIGISTNPSGGGEFYFARYLPSGALDTSFNGTGFSHFGPTGMSGAAGSSTYDYLTDLREDSSGRYVACGVSYTAAGGGQLAIVRYTANGTLDLGFNGVGYVLGSTTDAAGGSGSGKYDVGSFLQIDSSGKYIITGETVGTTGFELAIWRYTSAGALDTSFGSGAGFVIGGTTAASGRTANIFDTPAGMQIDSLGRYVVAGSTTTPSGGIEPVIWRYNSDGSLDSSFGNSGIILFGATGISGVSGAAENDSISGMVIDSAGRYVLADTSTNSAHGMQIALIRYLPSGALDTAFGSGSGFVTFGNTGAAGGTGAGESDSGSYNGANSVLLDREGRYLLFAPSKNTAGGVELAIWRYLPSGFLDR